MEKARTKIQKERDIFLRAVYTGSGKRFEYREIELFLKKINLNIIIFGLIGLPLNYSNVGLLVFERKNNLN